MAVSPLPAPPTMPPKLEGMAALLEKVDAAAALVGAVRQAADMHQRHLALSRVRAEQPGEMNGLYEVLKAFDFLGVRFERGALINRDIMPLGILHRFWLGKAIPLVENAAKSAAA